MFEVFYYCSNEYKQKVENFIFLWQSGIENLNVPTSGSTGTPKIISLKRSQILASVALTKETFQLKENFKTLSNLHIDYIAGKLMIIRAIEIGLKIDIVEPSSNPFLDIPKNQNYDFLAFIPLQLETLLKNTDSILKLNKAKVIIIGGAALNQQLFEKIQVINSPVFATYGMTETVTHIAYKRLNGLKINPFFECLEGVKIKKNKNNCLNICSENTDNKWIITNDLVEIKEERFFKLIGRIDNIINSGGVKIQLEKVENELQKQIINRFFCWGINDQTLGQKLVVFVEGTLNFNVKELELTKNLSKFEIPKEFIQIQSFIETLSGKIDKIKTVNEYFKNTVSNS